MFKKEKLSLKNGKQFKKTNLYYCHDQDFSYSRSVQYHILSSMWDPYGQLSDLPVAVVNNDKEASYNGNTMAIGKDMVSNLKENKTLDFHFVDEEEGKKGLEDGDYYMVVTLPSDLSEKTTTLSNIQSTAAYQSLTSEQQTEISDSVSQNSTDSIQSAQSIVALVQDLQEV